MLEEMVKSIVKKSIAVDYPHLKLPTVVFAKVDSVKKLDKIGRASCRERV